MSELANQNHLTICISLLSYHKKSNFCIKSTVTHDEKWIYYDNPKCRKSWVSPDQSSTSIPKRKIHGSKVWLWLGGKGVVYMTIMSYWNRIKQQALLTALSTTINRFEPYLNRTSNQKRPLRTQRKRKVILLNDNARPHVTKAVKDTLSALQNIWKILPHAAYSPDCILDSLISIDAARPCWLQSTCSTSKHMKK